MCRDENERPLQESPSPSVQLMQQNTRLVLVTLDVLQQNRIATAQPMPPPAWEGLLKLDASTEAADRGTRGGSASTTQASGSARGSAPASGNQPGRTPTESASESNPSIQPASATSDAASSDVPATDAQAESDSGEQPTPSDASAPDLEGWALSTGYACSILLPAQTQSHDGTACAADIAGTPMARALAVKLLLGFMGAVLNSLYAAQVFVETAFEAYMAGLTAGMHLNPCPDWCGRHGTERARAS